MAGVTKSGDTSGKKKGGDSHFGSLDEHGEPFGVGIQRGGEDTNAVGQPRSWHAVKKDAVVNVSLLCGR